MVENQPSSLTDQELLTEAKKQKSKNITNALLVGFLAGILVYSVWKNSLGFLSLIPLFLIYKLVNKSKYDKEELEREMKKRKLQ